MTYRAKDEIETLQTEVADLKKRLGRLYGDIECTIVRFRNHRQFNAALKDLYTVDIYHDLLPWPAWNGLLIEREAIGFLRKKKYKFEELNPHKPYRCTPEERKERDRMLDELDRELCR